MVARGGVWGASSNCAFRIKQPEMIEKSKGAEMYAQELFELASQMESEASSFTGSSDDNRLKTLGEVATKVGKAWSGSWLGYHANVYYSELKPPPPGAHFSVEWGLKDMLGSLGSRGKWVEIDAEELKSRILAEAGQPDLKAIGDRVGEIVERFDFAKASARSLLQTSNSSTEDVFIQELARELEELEAPTKYDILNIWKPQGQVMTRDAIAGGQGFRAPPHLELQAEVATANNTVGACRSLAKICRKAASHMERVESRSRVQERVGTNIFIGHGQSGVWRDLKDFLQDRLRLPWDEFNRVPVAGITNQARLAEMLDAAAFAFIVMTAEDETAEGQMNARMNVIHEVGLFQGRLGFTKAIVLLEEGCEEFSNIQGLGQIRFPAGNVSAKFEEIRQVLEREGLIVST